MGEFYTGQVDRSLISELYLVLEVQIVLRFL